MNEVFVTPSVGRIVRYHSYGSPGGEFKPEPRAAIVTAVHDLTADGWVISLCAFNPTGMFFNQNVKYSRDPKPGHWSWPPKV